MQQSSFPGGQMQQHQMNLGQPQHGYIRKQQSAPNSGPNSQPGSGRRQGGFPSGPQSKSNAMFGNSPQRGSHALVPKGPINLITNNFKIRSQNHGIIYTYSVDFIDGENAAVQQVVQQALP